MTHFEFWTNLATVILLVPAIILSFRLSRQLGKLNQNQERMIELAAALRRAAETAHGLGMELDFTSPGWLPEEALRDMGLHLIPSCGACLSNMALAPDGTVLPCQSWLEGPGLGNLLTDDWSGIWDGEPCRRIRAESAKMEHICQLRQEGGC